jgi:hypothetical protein
MTLLLLCLMQVTSAPAAGAPATAAVRVLPRSDFQFAWSRLQTPDRRFEWDGRIGYDVDALDYGFGRATFRGEYVAVVGRERRRYDLNQGTYYFDASGSIRVRGVEVSAVMTHVSRHLVDRDNQPAVSWNSYGVRVDRTFRAAGARIAGRLETARPTRQAFVDYTWMHKAEVTLMRPVAGTHAIVLTATGDAIRTDPKIAGRTRVCGGRAELALRLNGERGAVEVFGAYERRLDAFPADRFRVRFFAAGFRIRTR